MTELSGRVVALDAPANALGQAVSSVLARQGAQVLSITASNNPQNVADNHPDMDTLVLFLPTPPVMSIVDLSDDLWDMTVNTNLTRYFRLIKVVGANMIVRRRGLILLVGGLSGLTGFPGWTAASVLEGALIALTRSLACEWASEQVRVVYLACGSVEGQQVLSVSAPVAAQNPVDRTPLKRSATADEIANIIQYLVSGRASFFTGSVIRADGGWTSWGLLK